MQQTARRIAVLGIVISALLAILKITVGTLAHSAAVVADGFESATDVLTSGLVLVGLALASRPADENHPYGHGRVDIVIGLLLGFILAAAGVGIAWHGLSSAGDETHAPATWAVWPMVVSIGAKFWLVYAKYGHGRRIGSTSMVAGAANDASDMLSGVVALAALGLALIDPAKYHGADHWGAFGVGLIVIITGFRVMHGSSMELMDTMPDTATMSKIREVALSVDDVFGVEKCFARKTGFKYHVDLHLEVDPEITVRESHDIATRVRERIRQQLPWVDDVLVHVEPYPGELPG